MAIIAPITSDNGRQPSEIFVKIKAQKENGLSKDSVVDCFQIRSISLELIVKYLGHSESQIVDDVKRHLTLILDIGEEHVGHQDPT